MSRIKKTGLRLAAAAALLAPCLAGMAATPYPNTSFFGVDFDRGAAWYRHCMRVEKLAPPRPAPRAPTPKCSAQDLYDDAQAKPAASAAEWREVRECASATANDSVLMMLYANGYGVPRNPDLAIRYACGLENVALAEMESRVEHLAEGAGDKPFDFCDDITSGLSGATCADIQESRQRRLREAELDRYAATLAPAARPAFAALRTAAEKFARTSEDKESDMQGTAAVGLATGLGGKRRAEFLGDVRSLQAGTFARGDGERLRELDSELNRVYRAVLGKPSAQEGEPERIGNLTITREDVRATERTWVAYRNAWLAFLKAGAIRADANAVNAMLTSRRIGQLSRISH